jgi:hypothetical protein
VKFMNWIVMGSGGFILVVLSVILISPKAAHALAATLVQITNTNANPVPTATAVPGTPFFGFMQLSGRGAMSVGPGTGTLGVTQLILTNFDSVTDQVDVYAPYLYDGTCGGSNNVSGAAASPEPFLVVDVPPNSTLVIPAPTPLVFFPAQGHDGLPHTCVAASMTIAGNVFISVNGFVN